MRKITAAILAGGKGSRFQDLTGGITQKVLYPVLDKPLIHYSIDLFDAESVGRVVFCLGHLASEVRSWGEDLNVPFGLDFMEQERSGVAVVIGQVFRSYAEPEMAVCNGDEIRVGLDLKAALEFHRSHDLLGTMVATYANNLSRHRLLHIDPCSILEGSSLHPPEFVTEPNEIGLINTGLLILKSEAVELFEGDGWSGVIDPLSSAGKLAVHVQPGISYFNVGTPDEYREASRVLALLNTPP